MATKEQETTSVDALPARSAYEPAGQRHPDHLRRLLARLHRRPRRRPRKRRSAACRPLVKGDVAERRVRGAAAALHRAAAALHRGEPDQGPRGARHRPAVHVRGHHLDDHGSRLRQGPGAASLSRAGRRDRHGPARRPLRGVRRPRVHRPDGRRAGRRGRRQASLGPGRPRVLHARSGRGSRRRPRSCDRADFTTRPSDEVCSRGPSHGHPARPVRRVPRLLDVPGAQGDPGASRRAAGNGRRGRAPDGSGGGRPRPRSAPSAAQTTAACWSQRRGRFGPFMGCSRYPECDYIKKEGPPPPAPLGLRRRLPDVPPGPPGDAARPPDRARSSGAARAIRSCDSRPRTSRSAPLHDADEGPVGRAGDGGSVPGLRRRR